MRSWLVSTQKGMMSYVSAHGDIQMVAISFFSYDDFWKQVYKMTERKWNYMTDMIMNISGTHCQLIHYFPSKHGLAINLPWSLSKVCVLNFLTPSQQWCLVWGDGGRGHFINYLLVERGFSGTYYIIPIAEHMFLWWKIFLVFNYIV